MDDLRIRFRSTFMRFLDELIEQEPTGEFISIRVHAATCEEDALSDLSAELAKQWRGYQAEISKRDKTVFNAAIHIRIGDRSVPFCLKPVWKQFQADVENQEIMWAWVTRLFELACATSQ